MVVSGVIWVCLALVQLAPCVSLAKLPYNIVFVFVSLISTLLIVLFFCLFFFFLQLNDTAKCPDFTGGFDDSCHFKCAALRKRS